jgi:hypothetical protein
MKKIICILLVLSHYYVNANDWINILRSAQEYNQNSTAIKDSSNIIVVGDYGSIIKISLNGNNYELKYIDGDYKKPDLNKVLFSQGKFIAFGDSGIILVSEDNGETWDRSETDIETDIVNAVQYNQEVYFIADNKMYRYDLEEESIALFHEFQETIIDIISFDNKLIGVGWNGYIFEYSNSTGINEFNIGGIGTITTLFVYNGEILITPTNSKILKLDLENMETQEFRSDNVFSFVQSAITNTMGDIYLSGISLTGGIQQYYLPADSVVFKQSRPEAPIITDFIADKGITFFNGSEGLIGWIQERPKANWQFYGRILHLAPQQNPIKSLQVGDDIIYIHAEDIKAFDDDLEVLPFSEIRDAEYYLGVYNNDEYYIKTEWNPNNFRNYILYRYDGINSYPVDSSDTGGQNYGYIEHDDLWVGYNGNIITTIKKTDMAYQSINTDDIFISSLAFGEGKYMATTFSDDLYESNDLVNWKYIKSIDNGILSKITYNDQRFIYVVRSGSFNNYNISVVDYENDIELYSANIPKKLTSFTSADNFIGFSYTVAEFIYSLDNGSNWTKDTIPSQELLIGVLFYDKHIIAYTNKSIFVKNTALASSWNEYQIDAKIYPNPVNSGTQLSVQIRDTDFNNFVLIDLNGKTLLEGNVANNNAIQIPTYLNTQQCFLVIKNGNEILETRSIIIK